MTDMATGRFRSWNPAQPRRAPNIESSVWDKHKQYIQALHNAGRTRAEMLVNLKTEYDFHPSMSQLVAKLGSWGLKASERDPSEPMPIPPQPRDHQQPMVFASARDVPNDPVKGYLPLKPSVRESERLTYVPNARPESPAVFNESEYSYEDDYNEPLELFTTTQVQRAHAHLAQALRYANMAKGSEIARKNLAAAYLYRLSCGVLADAARLIPHGLIGMPRDEVQSIRWAYERRITELRRPDYCACGDSKAAQGLTDSDFGLQLVFLTGKSFPLPPSDSKDTSTCRCRSRHETNKQVHWFLLESGLGTVTDAITNTEIPVPRTKKKNRLWSAGSVHLDDRKPTALQWDNYSVSSASQASLRSMLGLAQRIERSKCSTSMISVSSAHMSIGTTSTSSFHRVTGYRDVMDIDDGEIMSQLQE